MRSFLLLLLLVALPVSAATRYIRTGATGAADGTNWTDAYTNLTQFCGTNPTRGDLFYIAAGTYTGQCAANKATSGTSTIELRKATVADHGTDTGWSASYATGQAVLQHTGTVIVCNVPGGQNTGYYVFNGNEGTLGSSTLGIRLYTTASRDSATGLVEVSTAAAFATTGDCDNWTFKQVEFDWDNGTSAGTSGATRCLFFQGSVDNDNLTLDRIWCHDSSGFGIYCNNCGDGLTIKNSLFSDNGGAGGSSAHHELLWLNPVTNAVVDGNTFRDQHDGDLTGWVMIGDSTNVRVSNNLFYCSSGADCVTGGNGIVATWSQDVNANTNVYIYNNSFVNLPATGNPSIYFTHDSADDTNVVCQNNLIYTSAFGFTGCDTNSYNAFGGGASSAGTNAQTGLASSIFTDYANEDFHLSANTTAGTDLSGTFTIDKDGVTRSAWDRGAYEYVSGGGETPNPIAIFLANFALIAIGLGLLFKLSSIFRGLHGQTAYTADHPGDSRAAGSALRKLDRAESL